MSVVIVTGSAGLIGSETVRFFANKGLDTVGIDNDMRREFFGETASTHWMRDELIRSVSTYRHVSNDIRDLDAMEAVFKKYSRNISAVVHCASQPSHDWAASDPFTDFTINANGTLTLLEMTRRHCPDAVFLFISTNKVYGDSPNKLPLVEHKTRWEVAADHTYYANGIDELMGIDESKHSLFGVSKAAADLMVQEYGRYFGMKTACFRGGCLTGPAHSGARLHGFLSYLVRCSIDDTEYKVMGYKGKQVRDNIHSYDFVNAMWHFFEEPKAAAVYNMGGGRYANCSIIEAIAMCEGILGRPMNWNYFENNRIGDHIWWISDTRRFQTDYPDWTYKFSLEDIMLEMFEGVNVA